MRVNGELIVEFSLLKISFREDLFLAWITTHLATWRCAYTDIRRLPGSAETLDNEGLESTAVTC
jgi:hypothetical protein